MSTLFKVSILSLPSGNSSHLYALKLLFTKCNTRESHLSVRFDLLIIMANVEIMTMSNVFVSVDYKWL